MCHVLPLHPDEQPAQPSAFRFPDPATDTPTRYTVEPHGRGHALYIGRDSRHHGLNLAMITEAEPATLQRIADALNAYNPAPGCPGPTGCGRCNDCKAPK